MTINDIIENTDNGKRIYEFYLDKAIAKNKLHKSIWTVDERTPSMSFYIDDKGHWRCKCWSTGNNVGPIEFVAVLRKIEFSAAANTVKADFNLIGSYKPSNAIAKPKLIEYNEAGLELYNYVTDSQQNTHNYWSQYKFITTQILEKYNVLNLILLEYINSKGVDKSLKKYRDNPLILYSIKEVFSDKVKHKVYRPYNEKSSKWFGDTNAYCLFGYHENKRFKLNKRDNKLIIFSSAKDLMAFEGLLNTVNIRNGIHYFGVNANSEMLINDFIMKFLFQEYELNGTDVYVLFDNDDKGIKTSVDYEFMYLANNVTSVQDGFDGKDIADICKNESNDNLMNFLEKIIKAIWQ